MTVTTITHCPPLPTATCPLLPAAAGMQNLGWLRRQQGLNAHLAVLEPSSRNVLVMEGKQGRGKCQDAVKQKF